MVSRDTDRSSRGCRDNGRLECGLGRGRGLQPRSCVRGCRSGSRDLLDHTLPEVQHYSCNVCLAFPIAWRSRAHPPLTLHDFAQWLLEALVSRAAPPAVRRAVRVAQHLHQDRRSRAFAKKTGVRSRPSDHTSACVCALTSACLTPPAASRLLFDTACPTLLASWACPPLCQACVFSLLLSMLTVSADLTDNQVHVVVYYRYYRFFPDGTLLYRTSPQVRDEGLGG